LFCLMGGGLLSGQVQELSAILFSRVNLAFRIVIIVICTTLRFFLVNQVFIRFSKKTLASFRTKRFVTCPFNHETCPPSPEKTYYKRRDYVYIIYKSCVLFVIFVSVFCIIFNFFFNYHLFYQLFHVWFLLQSLIY